MPMPRLWLICSSQPVTRAAVPAAQALGAWTASKLTRLHATTIV
jgi:hypothetical protein